MNEISFCGHIYNTDMDSVLAVLGKIFDKEKIKPKNKMFWDEINYEDKNMEIYVQSSIQYKSSMTEKDREEYQVNGEFFNVDQDYVKSFLNHLTTLFYDERIKCRFEYYEETEDGEQIGDSHMVEQPSFN